MVRIALTLFDRSEKPLPEDTARRPPIGGFVGLGIRSNFATRQCGSGIRAEADVPCLESGKRYKDKRSGSTVLGCGSGIVALETNFIVSNQID